MNYIVVGATAGLGRALAEALAAQGHKLVLVARDERDLSAQANHIGIISGVEAITVAVNLSSDQEAITKIVDATSQLPQVDGLFFPVGLSREDDQGSLGPAEVRSLTEANLTGIMALTSQYLPQMLQRGSGTIVGFGSIAAARGRKSNIVYAAAKRGLESYFESLRHLSAPKGIRVHFWNMGYLDTAQTYGKKLPLPAASPAQAAAAVVKNLNNDQGARYYPTFWRPICFALKLIPWFMYKKLNF